QGLKIVAVAIVANAVWGMARNLCTDMLRIAIAVAAACTVLLLPVAWIQMVVIFLAGLLGRALIRPTATPSNSSTPSPVSHRLGLMLLAIFFALLIALPILANAAPSQLLAMVDVFYRAGS